MSDADYAFPHAQVDERRRLDLFADRLDPFTIRWVERLGIPLGARCLELGGGRGSVARWLCELVGGDGRVTATDLDTGFLAEVWLLVEECDFGLWMGDFDPIWASHPRAWHEAFPNGSLSRGRAMLRQFPQLGLTDIGADGELDIVQPGTPLAEFYRLSQAAMAEQLIAAGVMTTKQMAELHARVTEPDFLGCGFAHIGAWGRQPESGPPPEICGFEKSAGQVAL